MTTTADNATVLVVEDAVSPWLKVPLEKVSRGIERLWARVRGGRKAG